MGLSGEIQFKDSGLKRGNERNSIGGKYLIRLICVMEKIWEMCEDLNNQKNDKVRSVVSHFSGYLCYVKMILQ